jgi:hypothetical protein
VCQAAEGETVIVTVRAGDAAQVVECLPIKSNALSSNPSTEKKWSSHYWEVQFHILLSPSRASHFTRRYDYDTDFTDKEVGSEKMSNLPKFTEFVNGRSWPIWLWARPQVHTGIQSLHCYTVIREPSSQLCLMLCLRIEDHQERCWASSMTPRGRVRWPI